MGDKESQSADLERLCQAVSPSDEPGNYPATVPRIVPVDPVPKMTRRVSVYPQTR